MYSLLVTIAAITAILLVVVVLLQASKGSGLAGTFGGAGGSMGSMFGTRRTADFLSRGTWWLGGIVAVLALVINLFFLPGKVTPEQRSIIQESGQQNIPQTPTLPQQNQFPPGTENPEGQ